MSNLISRRLLLIENYEITYNLLAVVYELLTSDLNMHFNENLTGVFDFDIP